jgi:hypothetical protein
MLLMFRKFIRSENTVLLTKSRFIRYDFVAIRSIYGAVSSNLSAYAIKELV